MSDENLCELKPSIASCPKCGRKMTNKWQTLKSNGKPMYRPILLDCYCECGYRVSNVKIPRQFVSTRC